MITSPATHPVKRLLINTKNMLRYYRDPLAYMTWMQRTYGRMSATTIGKVTMYAFYTPEAVRAVLVDYASSFTNRENTEHLITFIGDGLLTIDGELHKQHRRLLLPAFHRKRVESYCDTMVAYTQRLLDSWRPGEQVDMLGEMQRLTMSVAAKTLFNVEISERTEELGKAFATALEQANTYWVWRSVPFFRRNLPFTPYGRLYRAMAELDRFVYQVIAERRASDTDAGDIISMLLAARDEDGTALSDRQVRDEAMTILPERFDPQHGMKHPQFVFFPFGGGPRLCPGMMFAFMEARIVLAMLLQRYTPVLADASPVVPRPLITLRPKGGMRMRIEEAVLPATRESEKKKTSRHLNSGVV